MRRSQRFGTQTVTFVAMTPAADSDDLGTHAMVRTPVDVRYCLHHPRKASGGSGSGLAVGEEQPELGVSVATEWWQTTAPPEAAVLAAKPSDVISVGGEDFRIISGAKPFVDETGKVFKVTILSEKQAIG